MLSKKLRDAILYIKNLEQVLLKKIRSGTKKGPDKCTLIL